MLDFLLALLVGWIIWRIVTHKDRELDKQIERRKKSEAESLANAVRDVAKWKKEQGIPRVGREEDFYPND